MAKKVEDVTEKVEEVKAKAQDAMADVKEEVSPLFDAARRVVLAAVGAVALASDEIAEKDARKLMKEVTDRTEKQMKPAEKELDKRLEEMRNTLNIPTKHDIDALSNKVAELTAKVEALKN